MMNLAGRSNVPAAFEQPRFVRKRHHFHLILGLNYAYRFPGVVYQPRHAFQNDDFGSKFRIHIHRS